jgi:AcrR family transcriptional regulator
LCVPISAPGARKAILDTTAALVAEGGLLSVTMSRIAEEAGIGRATLYKYFPDVEAILRRCGRHRPLRPPPAGPG